MATVIIWNNHYYPINSYPGHAAMNIDDDWSLPGQLAGYVSWWPGDEDKRGLTKESVDNQLHISQDLELEGYAPDHIIQIPGLNSLRMRSKWQEIRQDRNRSYRFLRQNCSTIVSMVLKEGGHGGSVMQRNNLVWTPLKVMRLAHAMGGVELTWANFLGSLQQARYLSASDVIVLSNLFKRDAKHGRNATGNQCYYSNGRKVNSKTLLQWQDYTVGGRSAHGGMPFLRSHGGSLLTQGQIGVNEDGDGFVYQRDQFGTAPTVGQRGNVTIGRGRRGG